MPLMPPLSLTLPSASLVSFDLRAGILHLQWAGGGWGIKRQQTNTPGRQTSLNAAAGGTHSTVAALLRLSLVPLAAPDEHMPANLDVKKNKKKTREKSKPLLALCLCCVLREQPEGRANSGRNQIYICYRSRGRRAGLLRGAANGATLPAIFHRTHLHLL